MKKKQIAVLLAALLSVSPAVEGVAVMGADFSSGEEAVEAMQEQTETEDSAAENVATETEEAENAGITEDIWTSWEEISEFETGEEEQQDMFVEEPDAQTESATAAQEPEPMRWLLLMRVSLIPVCAQMKTDQMLKCRQ